MLIELLSSNNSSDTIFDKILIHLFTPKFLKVLVSKLNKRSKIKLESVQKFESTLINRLTEDSEKISDETKLGLIKNLFGPNALRRFTLKNNFSIFVQITQSLNPETITNLTTYAQDMFKSPVISNFYPEDPEDNSSSDDEDEKSKFIQNKEDNIRIYSLNLLVNTVGVFKNHTDLTLKNIMNFIVYQAYFNNEASSKLKEFAKDKLFALVDAFYYTSFINNNIVQNDKNKDEG